MSSSINFRVVIPDRQTADVNFLLCMMVSWFNSQYPVPTLHSYQYTPCYNLSLDLIITLPPAFLRYEPGISKPVYRCQRCRFRYHISGTVFQCLTVIGHCPGEQQSLTYQRTILDQVGILVIFIAIAILLFRFFDRAFNLLFEQMTNKSVHFLKFVGR